jgi:hypothetical protein
MAETRNPWKEVIEPIRDEALIRELLGCTVERCLEIIDLKDPKMLSDYTREEIHQQLKLIRAGETLNWKIREYFCFSEKLGNFFTNAFTTLIRDFEHLWNSVPDPTQYKLWLYRALSAERWAYDPDYDDALIADQINWIKKKVREHGE